MHGKHCHSHEANKCMWCDSSSTGHCSTSSSNVLEEWRLLMSDQNKNPSSGKGFIYILSNPSMTNLYKVGLTTNSVRQRIQELNSTGVPRSFRLEKKYEIGEDKLLSVERLTHKKLTAKGLHHGKEFFHGRLRSLSSRLKG